MPLPRTTTSPETQAAHRAILEDAARKGIPQTHQLMFLFGAEPRTDLKFRAIMLKDGSVISHRDYKALTLIEWLRQCHEDRAVPTIPNL